LITIGGDAGGADVPDDARETVRRGSATVGREVVGKRLVSASIITAHELQVSGDTAGFGDAQNAIGDRP